MTNDAVNARERPPKIQVASTFFDRATAETEIARVLADNDAEVRRWLSGVGGQLTLMGRASRVVGMLVADNADRPDPGRGVKVVLRRNAGMSLGYYIHTVMVMK